MAETNVTRELPNLVNILAHKYHGTRLAHYLLDYEQVIFSIIVISVISFAAFAAARRLSTEAPGRLQCAAEAIAGGFDDFVCGIIGPKGRTFTPFIGTLFIYILCMNISGLIPLMKSSTASWSTTLALAICVFFYLQYTALKELGPGGYIYHLMERPKGVLAFSVVIPVILLFLHIISELIRPISLSLRLRSNIWGDDMIMSVFYGFGLPALPLVLFSALIAVIAAAVQAVVFTLLTTVYFTLVLSHED
ncbi:MAG: F0F1 ATP synthase subunit A [Candidatus Omnitrophica bacterium]|nr:F0F1 ATP synthase subunit A [Candidatus Omnitrophota bacterium]